MQHLFPDKTLGSFTLSDVSSEEHAACKFVKNVITQTSQTLSIH